MEHWDKEADMKFLGHTAARPPGPAPYWLADSAALWHSRPTYQRGPKNVYTLQHEKYLHKSFITRFI